MAAFQTILNSFEINQSLFWIMGLFVVTYVLMKYLCLKRLSVALVQRDLRIEGREEEAQELVKELTSIQQTLQVQMKKARLEANEAFVSLRNKAAEQQRSILTAARETAMTEIKTARLQVSQKLDKEMKLLEAEVPSLAKLIVEQILGGRSKKKGFYASASTEL